MILPETLHPLIFHPFQIPAMLKDASASINHPWSFQRSLALLSIKSQLIQLLLIVFNVLFHYLHTQNGSTIRVSITSNKKTTIMQERIKIQTMLAVINKYYCVVTFELMKMMLENTKLRTKSSNGILHFCILGQVGLYSAGILVAIFSLFFCILFIF